MAVLAGGKSSTILGAPTTVPDEMEGESHEQRHTALKRAVGLGYTPGGAAERRLASVKRPCVVVKTSGDGAGRRKHGRAVLSLPSDCILKIVQALVKSKDNHTVIILGMVNKQYRQVIAPDVDLWYAMYMHWRGPPTPSRTVVSMGGKGTVRLLPSIPRTLPNFRDLGMSIL